MNSPAISTTTTASVPYLPEAQVVIARQADYESKALRARLEQMFSDLWEFEKIVPFGAKVVIKVDLSGGVKDYNLPGLPAVESVATHPAVVRAVAELLIDAGANQIAIVEALPEADTFAAWGYEEIAGPLDAQLIDLNRPDPSADFTELSAGPDASIYKSFTANRILSEADTFISIPKMKCHSLAGLALSMHNLVSMVPLSFYREKDSDTDRSSFFVDASTRLPRIIIDLNRARPIHLAVIDGVKTVEGGEGAWVKGVNPVAPGLLIAGKNALATDTIAATVMGFDASARSPKIPFPKIENYLNIAHNLELGTNMLEKIDLLGPSLAEVTFPFRPPSD